jgi:hypothetical protein
MDLAVIYGPAADLHLSVQNLGRDAVAAVGWPGSGRSRKMQVEMDWLLRQKLVLPSQSHGLRALIEHAAAKKKLKLDIQVEADSFRVLVEVGLGFALLPPSSVRDEVAAGKLEVAGIAKQGPMRELIIASPIDHPGTAAFSAVTALLKSETAVCRDEGPGISRCPIEARRFLTLSLLASGAAPARQSDPNPPRLALINGKIVTLDASRKWRRHSKFATPGLIETHAHFKAAGYLGWTLRPCERYEKPV